MQMNKLQPFVAARFIAPGKPPRATGRDKSRGYEDHGDFVQEHHKDRITLLDA